MDKTKLLKYSGFASDDLLTSQNDMYDPSLYYKRDEYSPYIANGSDWKKGRTRQLQIRAPSPVELENGGEQLCYENGIPSALRCEDGTYRRLHEVCYQDKYSDEDSPIRGSSRRPGSKNTCRKIACLLIFVCFLIYIPVYKQANSRHDSEKNITHKDGIVSKGTHSSSSNHLLNSSNLGLSTLHASKKVSKEDKTIFDKLWSSSKKGSVAGWSYNTSRNTRNYVLPDNVTILNQPKFTCRLNRKTNSSSNVILNDTKTSDESDGIFLLVIICSSMDNFEARAAIRDTWGNQSNYEILSRKFDNITRHFMNINVTDKLLNDIVDYNVSLLEDKRVKRDLTDVEDYRDLTFDGILSESPLGYENSSGFDNHTRVFSTVFKEVNNSLSRNNSYFNSSSTILRVKRDLTLEDTESVDDPRFDHGENKLMTTQIDPDSKAFSNFEEGEQKEFDYYDYQTEVSNIMKIPSRGEKLSDDESMKNAVNDAKKILKLSISDDKLKLEINNEIKHEPEPNLPPQVKIKFLFLLGQSSDENDTELQSRIDDESNLYGDIIQESFIDSYNNLTLKSVMLLKWAVMNCRNSVRYIMKTDDDMFINIPRLIEALQNKSKEHFAKSTSHPSAIPEEKLNEEQRRAIIKQEKLLMGDLICDARPISDTSSKWYSPAYMYGGAVYPRYLSGTGYVMSYGTAEMLYKAALDTPLFHLEDIYVTGICSQKAGIKPTDHPGFSYSVRKFDLCNFVYLISAHKISPFQIRRMHNMMIKSNAQLENCEMKRILAKKNVSTLEHVKEALFKLPILGSPKSFINGLVGLGYGDGKIAKLGTISNTKKRKKANTCF